MKQILGVRFSKTGKLHYMDPKDYGFRVSLDDREEKLGYRMRNVQMQKIPYTLVLGDKEKESMSVNVRKYGKEGQEPMQLEAFLA